MKTTILISLLAAIMPLGCSHTLVLNTASPSFDQLQRQAKNGQAIVTVKNDQSYQNVRLTQVAPDSISWMLQNGQLVSAATEEITEIRFINREEGALDGLGIGLLAGAVIGALLGAGEGSNSEGFTPSSTEANAMAGAIVLGGLGGLIGMPIGSAVGSKDIYVIEPNSSQPAMTMQK